MPLRQKINFETIASPVKLLASRSNPPTPLRNSLTHMDDRFIDPESLGTERNIISFYNAMDAEEDEIAARHYQSHSLFPRDSRQNSSQSDSSTSQLSNQVSSHNSSNLWILNVMQTEESIEATKLSSKKDISERQSQT